MDCHRGTNLLTSSGLDTVTDVTMGDDIPEKARALMAAGACVDGCSLRAQLFGRSLPHPIPDASTALKIIQPPPTARERPPTRASEEAVLHGLPAFEKLGLVRDPVRSRTTLS